LKGRRTPAPSQCTLQMLGQRLLRNHPRKALFKINMPLWSAESTSVNTAPHDWSRRSSAAGRRRWRLRAAVTGDLKGNSTLKNISPKINIYYKWIYVSVIKLTMERRYRRILTIKFLISRNVFRHGGGSNKPSSLFLYYFYICVYLLTLTWLPKNCCSYVLSCVKTCIVSTVWQEIPQSFDPHVQPFKICNAFINSPSSTVNYAQVMSFVTPYHWCA